MVKNKVSNEIIKRDSICIGQVAKIDTLVIKDRQFTPSIYKAYRSILFNIDNDGLCNDLIYDSPKYTILNYEANDIYLNNLAKDSKNLGFNPKVVVINALNIGLLLKKLGFKEELSNDDIIYIKNVIFNKKVLEDKCYQFGLVPTNSKKTIGWYDKTQHKEKYEMGPTKLYYDMKPYRDAIDKYGSDKKTAVLKKGFKANLDAFRPSRKESKVKLKKINRV